MSEPDGFPEYEPSRDLAASRPPRPPAVGHLIGRVESSATRVESHGREFGSETTVTFRLVDPDGQGPRDVQLRGRSISGTVRDGDWVEVSERGRSGRLEVDTVLNLTTGAVVKASGSATSTGGRVFLIVFLIGFVLILLMVALVALGMFGVLEWGPFGDGGPFGNPFDR